MARVTFFDKDGTPTGADIRAATVREWVLNADPSPGRCTFDVSRNDRHNSLDYLEFGSYVLVREENLPDWLGVIVRRTHGAGSTTITAYQAEFVLDKRKTKIETLKGKAGSIFRQILTKTNSELYNEKKVSVSSDVFYGGSTRQETTGKSALYHSKILAARAGHDFRITFGTLETGKIYLIGNWYEVMGENTEYTLREGYNIELASNVLEEDARAMANAIEGRGDASTDGTRPTYYAADLDSIARYGLWQESETYSGNKETATVRTNTLNTLLASRNPFSSYDVTALPVGNTYRNLDIGNVLYLDLVSGYDSDTKTVRILGMEKNDLQGNVRLIVELYDERNINAG